VKPLSSKLRPLQNLTQVDKIELSLQEYFRNENFQPGDPVPKEVELAEALGVSRTAIREALSRFKTLGIIESRKNRGMIISKPDILMNMERVLSPQLLDKDTMKEIFELRLVIEVGLGDILFLRRTDAYLAKLETIVEKYEKAKTKADQIKYDAEFHAFLYKMSGNKTIQRFQKMLLPIFEYINNSLRAAVQEENSSYTTHRNLLNILRKGTPEEFNTKMRNHLKNYFEKV
jgi:DNA-binding FadR family transcriptional regulator